MSEKIISKVYNRGDPCESEWPSDYGTLERGIFHIDEGTHECKPGYPAPKIQKYGEAPYIMPDSITPYYHPGACRTVETRSELRAVDKACGTITTDKRIEPDSSVRRKWEKDRAYDSRAALEKAVAQIDSGNAPLTEEQRAKCERQNEIVAAALPQLDPFNAVGRVSNAKGRRYKRKFNPFA